MKTKKFETFFTFQTVPDFEKFLHTKKWKDGELDYVTVAGKVYTIHEYDMDGQYMSWGNKANDELIDCTTSNRYSASGFTDAKLYLFENYGMLREDIHYQE